MPIVDQLRKRRDFLAAAKAERAGVSAFLLQGRDRGDGGDVRIGFTVTKKTGNAVVRNRIRRRLREVARQVVPDAGRPGYDYVLVAREQALAAPFGALLSDLGKALRKLHDPTRVARSGGSRRTPRSPVERQMREGGAKGASPQGVAPALGDAPHSDSKISSDPQAPSADGGHSA